MLNLAFCLLSVIMGGMGVIIALLVNCEKSAKWNDRSLALLTCICFGNVKLQQHEIHWRSRWFTYSMHRTTIIYKFCISNWLNLPSCVLWQRCNKAAVREESLYLLMIVSISLTTRHLLPGAMRNGSISRQTSQATFYMFLDSLE